MDCSKYSREGKLTYVFGKTITDNSVDGSNAMCNTFSGRLNNLDGIDTVANSKRNFSTRYQKKAQLMQCFQHVSGHPSNKTLIYFAVTNSIKKSLIIKRDVLMMLEQLGKSKYTL